MASVERDGDRLIVRSPGVGYYVGGPRIGEVVVGDQKIGSLEILGRRVIVATPAAAGGAVVAVAGDGESVRVAVGFGELLLVLDPEVGGVVLADDSGADVGGDTELVFRAPSGGRFYSRPAPDRAAFVAVGDVIKTGQPVYMLEVMKTFSRVRYAGDGLPAEARVVAIRPSDQDDIEHGDIVLELEPL